jgi:uncharacterized membrane protein YoaK (UPF0700 family)
MNVVKLFVYKLIRFSAKVIKIVVYWPGFVIGVAMGILITVDNGIHSGLAAVIMACDESISAITGVKEDIDPKWEIPIDR